MEKKVTVISGDSTHILGGGGENEVVIIKGGKMITSGKSGKIVTWSSSGTNSGGASYVYINEDKESGKKGEKNFGVRVTTDEKDNNLEMTKYVLAKDGMVVTIEGNDEEKAKELIKEVEAKLGISKGDKTAKKVTKEESKKTNKK
jgi:hypothetical protein